MIVNNELETVWKEVIVSYFKVPSQHFPGETMKYDDKSVWIASFWTEIWIWAHLNTMMWLYVVWQCLTTFLRNLLPPFSQWTLDITYSLEQNIFRVQNCRLQCHVVWRKPIISEEQRQATSRAVCFCQFLAWFTFQHWRLWRYVALKHQAISKLLAITTQTIPFIVAAMRTSNPTIYSVLLHASPSLSDLNFNVQLLTY